MQRFVTPLERATGVATNGTQRVKPAASDPATQQAAVEQHLGANTVTFEARNQAHPEVLPCRKPGRQNL